MASFNSTVSLCSQTRLWTILGLLQQPVNVETTPVKTLMPELCTVVLSLFNYYVACNCGVQSPYIGCQKAMFASLTFIYSVYTMFYLQFSCCILYSLFFDFDFSQFIWPFISVVKVM